MSRLMITAIVAGTMAALVVRRIIAPQMRYEKKNARGENARARPSQEDSGGENLTPQESDYLSGLIRKRSR